MSSFISSNKNSNYSGNSAPKKARHDGKCEGAAGDIRSQIIDLEEFKAVQDYIRACPLVAPHHPAIVAALEGIDRECKKQQRDAKLQEKFLVGIHAATQPVNKSPSSSSPSSSSSSSSAGMAIHPSTGETDDESQELVVVETTTESNGQIIGTLLESKPNSSESDDWHEINNEDEIDEMTLDIADDGSQTFVDLAREAIASVALYKVRVSSPVEAIAVAVHAALRGRYLGFTCTGTPDSTSAAGGGFAPPVRELAASQFLPKNWNSTSHSIAFRYRKSDTGSLILRVEYEPSTAGLDVTCLPLHGLSIRIDVFPNVASLSDANVEPSDPLTFTVGEYINLHSFERALLASHSTNERGIAPALHYKSLSTLLKLFIESFDLGLEEMLDSETTKTSQLPYVDSTIRRLPAHSNPSCKIPLSSRSNLNVPSSVDSPSNPYKLNDSRTPTIASAFPNLRRPVGRGDFADDVLVGGGPISTNIPDIGSESGESRFIDGNLMGPNHPRFMGGDGGSALSGIGPNSGFGMRPRFDPINGPPGGPADPTAVDIPGMSHVPHFYSRRFDGPNPDHLDPPNTFHSNMFM